MKAVNIIAEKFESGEMAVYQRETRCSDKARWAESILSITNTILTHPLTVDDISEDFVNESWAEYVKLCMEAK